MGIVSIAIQVLILFFTVITVMSCGGIFSFLKRAHPDVEVNGIGALMLRVF